MQRSKRKRREHSYNGVDSVPISGEPDLNDMNDWAATAERETRGPGPLPPCLLALQNGGCFYCGRPPRTSRIISWTGDSEFTAAHRKILDICT
jgi:hypothetical protein